MRILENIKKEVRLFEKKPKIILAEGWNKTIQDAAIQLKTEDIIEPYLIFKTTDQLKEFNNSLNICTFTIDQNDLSDYANLLFELRKNKGLTIEQASELVKQPNYLACLMLKNENNCGVVCGIEYTTKDTLRAALQVIKAKSGIKIVSSAMILERQDMTMFMSDIGLTINPSAEELAAIVDNTINFVVKQLGIKNNNVAMLSYSTNGSGAGESVDKVKNAYQYYINNYPQSPDANVYGEIQFDAAFDSKIRSKKCANSSLTNNANIFIFPNLDAGNIGYKMLQRLANFEPTGPIILGLDKPVNDLSRGANIYEVVSLCYVTALQTK